MDDKADDEQENDGLPLGKKLRNPFNPHFPYNIFGLSSLKRIS